MTSAITMTGKLRRAYFALCRELGLDDAMRRAFNERVADGRRSTREFRLTDWRNAVAELQRLNGQETEPGRPRIRNRGAGVGPGSTVPGTPGGFDAATAAQVETIESLERRIAWRKSAVAFVRARVLVPLRQMRWSGAWSGLARDEATKVILAMQKMAGRKR